MGVTIKPLAKRELKPLLYVDNKPLTCLGNKNPSKRGLCATDYVNPMITLDNEVLTMDIAMSTWDWTNFIWCDN